MSQRDCDSNQLEPAYSVIIKCGEGVLARGIEQVARVTGAHPSRVRRWMMPPGKMGTGGLIPARHQQTLLEWGERRGLLEPRDFFGRAPPAPDGGPRSCRAYA